MSTNIPHQAMVISEATKPVPDYHCVNCMSVLWDHGPAELCCHNCGRSFPVLNEIPILTSRPHELLLVHLEEFKQAQTAWMEKQSRCFGMAKAAARPATSARAERMLHGMTENLRLIGTFITPIEDFLSKGKKQASNLIDWALSQNVGSAPQTMLPFFYQDWARTRDFEEAESLIVSGLLEHRPDEKTIAILGAGACGLVSSTARHFRRVYGVDLSVPTLLIAQAVLRGHTIEVYVPNAGWRCSRLTPPSQAQNEIRLIAADVGTLPFAEGSLSAVVTQYLMDITGDPLGVADEIQRVLKPGGIWVNFSNPFKIPGELPELGPPEPSELQELFAPLGLDMVKAQRTRFTLQNLDQIYAGGHRNAQEVHFFIARKAASSARAAPGNRLQVWNRHDEASWWQLVPRIVPGREIHILRKRVFGPGGREDRIEIGLNSVSFSISGEHTAFVDALFGPIDGQHTLRQIFGILAAQGIVISETDFRELIYSLLRQYCVITLRS
jgi:SAM-dependent methyltransferase